jgi:O-antigen ligase
MQTLKGSSFILGNGLSGYPLAVSSYHQEGIFFNRDKMENFHSILYGNAELRAKYWQPVEIYLYPHNIFLNFWTELGIFGMLVFTWLIGIFLLKSFNVYRSTKNILSLGLFSAMIAMIIHGLVDVPYFKNDLSALFFVILALLASILLDNKVKNNNIIKS